MGLTTNCRKAAKTGDEIQNRLASAPKLIHLPRAASVKMPGLVINQSFGRQSMGFMGQPCSRTRRLKVHPDCNPKLIFKPASIGSGSYLPLVLNPFK